jgi:hypothetical protein
MLRRAHSLVLSLSLIAGQDPAQSTLFNADFERPELISAEGGWSMPDVCRSQGFRIGITDDEPAQGASCAVLYYENEAAPEGFGNLIQSTDAAAFRGKVVSFSASVRVEGDGYAQLWLRTDGKDGFSALIDNMSDRPVRSKEWARYEIKGSIDPKSDHLVLGMMLFGGGRAWIDDVKLTSVGDSADVCEPPRELEGRGLRNLVAYARLLGYVAFFHPSDEVKGIDWMRFTPKLAVIEAASDDAELVQRLQAFFAPVAPTVQVFATDAPPPKHPALALPSSADQRRLTRWRHVGFGHDDRSPIYSRRRDKQTLQDGKPREGWSWPEATYDAELVPGVSCRVPLCLWSDKQGTLPHVPKGAALFDQAPFQSGNDRATRISDVIFCWNVFQHFYPYFDVVEVDWPKELEKALASAATDAGEAAFADTLRRLVAALRDGHGSVQVGFESGTFFVPPIEPTWVGDQLVVLGAAEDSGVHAGDVILSIDGVAVADAWKKILPLVAASTPQFARHKALPEFIRGGPGNTVLELQCVDGTKHAVTLERQAKMFHARKREVFCELEPGIFYFNLGRGEDKDFEAALPKLAEAKGIVYDLRGYPRIWMAPLAHLITEPIESQQWLVPTPRHPDRKDMTFAKSSWTVQPIEPRFAAKVAFLTDGRAISAAETYMGIVEFYDLGTIVGEPTAGTNGNVNPFTLPGGYTISWTGMKVLRQDGARHHGVGVQPDVPCSRTIAGIAAGRDEQLEKALEIVRR